MVVTTMGELLSLQGVCKYDRRRDRWVRVLVDIELEVRAGEIVAVLGSSYDGKTALLQIAAGLQRPDSGEVWFGDIELTRCSDEERSRLLREQIAWVHREGPGLGFKVVEYIAIPLVTGRGFGKREARDRAMQALERVGASHCAQMRWEELSHWERSLVAFAQGIARRPRLMVIDDVIDGFGMSRTREASELLLSFARELGCGILIGVSDFEAAQDAERVLRFEHGRLELISGHSDGGAEVINLHDSIRQSRGSHGAGA